MAPLTNGTDGGMNRVFVAKLADPTYTYDNNGHIHVPPLQPGRLPPAISPPRGSESDMTAAIAAPPAEPGSVGNIFGSMFASHASAEPAVASTDSGSHSGFFGGLFGSKGDVAQQQPAPQASAPVRTATAPPRLRPSVRTAPTATASVRPKAQPQTADAGKPKPKTAPIEQASAFAPAASSGSLISGAQPVVPAGNFNSRWRLYLQSAEPAAWV